jgi:hypothetical protein
MRFSMVFAKKRIAVVLALGLVAACSDNEMKPIYPVKIAVNDGIKTVMNPDYPRDGRVTYDMIEELSIGKREGDGNYLLTSPVDIDVADNGEIYVSDWRDVRIQVYDKDGIYRRTIGRPGQGPGDFEVPFYVCLTSDGKICVLEMRAHRISVLDIQGDYLSGFRLPGSCEGLDIDGNGKLYYRKINTPEPTVQGVFQWIQNMDSFYRADPDGTETVNLFSFNGRLGLNKRMGESAVILNAGIGSMWAVHKNGELSVGFNESYEIFTYDSAGEPRLKFGRSYTPVKRILPEIDPRVRANMESMKSLNLVPKYWPAFFEFVLDGDDNLWVRNYSNEGKKEDCIYDVFSSDGLYLKQVRMKNPVKVFKNGRAYSIVKAGEDDIPMIKRFLLEERH